MRKILALFLIFIYMSGCVSKPGLDLSNPSSGLRGAARDEVLLGEQIHQQIISKIPVCPNGVIQNYVSEVGSRISRFAKRQDLPYRFIVLEDERIYATSAPGGFIYVTSGLLIYLHNESELAGVLAHEIAQLQFKDYRLSTTRKMMEQLLTSGAVVAPVFGNLGALALLGLMTVYATTERNPSQEKRLRKADRAALALLTKAGEDPQGLLNFERRVLGATPRELMYLYDYHQSRPVTEDRVHELETAFASLTLAEVSFDAHRERFLQMTQPIRQSAVAV